ncbi:MAG TPA: S8 family serine peptidase [Petrimonas sp.]|jgi:subtilisin family serine protease|nr:S8 family serine peptidase [Petrimonas sp.]
MMNRLRALASFVSFLLFLAAPAVLVPVSVSASTVTFDSDKVGVKAEALTKSLILSGQPVVEEDTSSLETGASLRYKFRVYLSDKGKTGCSLDDPSRFLSHQAIERRERQGVALDELDLPIARDYIALVELAGGKVVASSKWLSTLVVETKDSLGIVQIEALPFVDSVKYIWRGIDTPYHGGVRPRLAEPKPPRPVIFPQTAPSTADTSRMALSDAAASHAVLPGEISPYGATEDQFKLHNARMMGDAGYRGKGIVVGVIDAGFTNVDVIPWFDTMDLRGFKDFVPGGDIFSANDHGTKVLSTMVINRPGKMMGSAPEAAYWLFRSEDVVSEFPVEEDYWVQAIEYADSVGVDLVNTSLGYNLFNDSSLNYSHHDLTGRISVMSRAADLAFQKGIIVVVSAGNEGNKAWGKSTPPGDAKEVVAVGAVGTDSVIALFSSRGMMADGRVKPDLVSVGRNTVTIGQNGLIGNTNGTSLSSPFLAGLIASLWSIHPELHRAELLDIVTRSSDRYASPDTVYGHGIPDFQKAMSKVLKTLPEHPGRVADGRWSIESVAGSTTTSDLTTDSGTHSAPQDAFLVKLLDRAFDGDAYRVRLLDESGALLSEHPMGEGDEVLVPIPRHAWESSRCLYFMIEEPFKQSTYRVGLR